MWRLVREGFRINRNILLSACVSSTVGVAGIFAALALTGAIERNHAVSWGALALPSYLLYATAVVGWIVIGTDLAEHRLRLHVLLPLPLAHLALARLLLPAAVLLLIGLLLAHAAAAIDQAVFGAGSLWLGHAVLDLMAVHLLLLQQLTLAVKEVTVLRAAGRGKAALGTLFVSLVVLADLLYGLPNATVVLVPGFPMSTHITNLAACTAAPVALALLTAGFTVALFVRRTEITR
ncbi:MAG: hypothetical protein JOZ15_11135 [Acidobacteria bacterium]|nr:hypothetical protein [Acidobacteriota bacterium]